MARGSAKLPALAGERRRGDGRLLLIPGSLWTGGLIRATVRSRAPFHGSGCSRRRQHPTASFPFPALALPVHRRSSRKEATLSKVIDYEYDYFGLWSPRGICRVRIYTQEGQLPFVVLTEPEKTVARPSPTWRSASPPRSQNATHSCGSQRAPLNLRFF